MSGSEKTGHVSTVRNEKRRRFSVIAQNPLFPGSKSTFQHTARRQTAFLKMFVYIQLQLSVIKVAK